VTARRRRAPSLANSSPAASAAGTIAQPGCEREALCESSVSSACAITPLASAASPAAAVSVDPTMVAAPFPPCERM